MTPKTKDPELTDNPEAMLPVTQEDEDFGKFLYFYKDENDMDERWERLKNLAPEAANDWIERGRFARHRTRSTTDKDARIAVLEAENARLTELLDEMQAAETAFRWAHDYYGAGNRETGRAWDLMRRCGDNARQALKGQSNAD